MNLPLKPLNRRHADQTYEAIILLATTPTKPDTTSVLQHQSLGINAEQALPPPADAIIEPANLNIIGQTVAAATACQEVALVLRLITAVTSPFNGSTHYGTDYKAADGTQIRSMADGTIERVGFDERPLPVPDPRSGKMVKDEGNMSWSNIWMALVLFMLICNKTVCRNQRAIHLHKVRL